MEKKINIAELLKDCPKGMELDCVMYEDVYFDYVDKLNIIHCYVQHENHKISITFNQHGTPNSDIKSKCVIFPKGKTTWEGFQRPFKDGDILSYQNKDFKNRTIYIYMQHSRMNTTYYVALSGNSNSEFMINDKEGCALNNYNDSVRFATEEEKEKLFDAIKANGYRWNAETKTLEKLPKFKVRDRVKHISAYTSGIVVKVDDKGYYIDYPKGEGVCFISFTLEKDYELAPNKFDITTLKPFESRVLVRSTNEDIWIPAIYGFTDSDKYYMVGGLYWKKCIPYNEETKHLLGTTNDCDEFYKTWT